MPDRPYRNLLEALCEQGLIALDGDTVAISSHEAKLTPEQETLAGKLMKLLEKSKVSAPFIPEISEDLNVPPADLKNGP